MSRARNQPDGALLARAIDHVRRAIELERDLAEAHATLAFLLVSAGRSVEALAAARRAVALEPGYWGNQFRLAHAAWGDERLQALGRAMELYPDFPFAHFEAAMVHIARGMLDRAESTLREGTIVQDRQAHLKQRYPAKGLHWLLGLVRLARGDAAEALLEFDREIALGRGAALRAGVRDERARRRRIRASRHRRCRCGRRAVPPGARAVSRTTRARWSAWAPRFAPTANAVAADAAFARASSAIEALRRGGRSGEAAMAEALPPRRARPSRTTPSPRCTGCSTRRSCRSPAGPSRSSRCSHQLRQDARRFSGVLCASWPNAAR